jgi:hypothetical protein
MDVYGAFQLCSIGILAAPVVVRLSRTYFYDPGRTIIFLWTILILVGGYWSSMAFPATANYGFFHLRIAELDRRIFPYQHIRVPPRRRRQPYLPQPGAVYF